eukprot:gnl/TRDRNA2_/TRDRNA2_204787_c0_seq1.p1 gnl/TRDRNA2_/TRDRNA2_204787_c0~~gnl/TRDRNA2_/TRDRNA2_204787_c0_seq1.p1  ORF type:complete len:100 (+),score=6.57 gnl/TRDRNA2_/TRDRNA2_204787_c0_seq1:506-805(+)
MAQEVSPSFPAENSSDDQEDKTSRDLSFPQFRVTVEMLRGSATNWFLISSYPDLDCDTWYGRLLASASSCNKNPEFPAGLPIDASWIASVQTASVNQFS